MALDGLILRRESLEATGKVLNWLPLSFGLLVGLAMLAAALEARYRLAHPERYAGG